MLFRSPDDKRGLGVSGPFTFFPNQEEEFDLAFVYGRNDTIIGPFSNIQNRISVMLDRIDATRQMFFNDSTPCGIGLFTALPEPVKTTPATEIQLYPNPAKNILYVKLGEQEGVMNYSIYDLLGRNIKSGQLLPGHDVINLQHLRNGMYIVRFSNGEMIESRKFVKKN